MADERRSIRAGSNEPNSAAGGPSSGTKRRNRVKTGCITCRIRRVKCDETRPNCQRCTSTGRKCDGYPSLPMSRRDLPVAIGNKKSLLLSCHQVTGVPGFTDGTEILYFDFFREKTSPGTTHFLTSDFWRTLVPQLAHDEPAIKHAVLAISALHQQWDLYGTTTYNVDRNAITQYTKGMGEAQKMMKRTRPGADADKVDIEKVLVACILFVCFENLIGDYSSAAAHLHSGLQILAGQGMHLAGPGAHSSLAATIVEQLSRLDFQSMTFAQAQFPMRKAAMRFSASPRHALPLQFESLAQVRTYLFELVNWQLAVGEVLALSRYGVPQHPIKTPAQMFQEASAAHARAAAYLNDFWALVEEFVDRSCRPTNPEFRNGVEYAYLYVYYRMSQALNLYGCTGYESNWDECLPTFADVLDRLEFLQRSGSEGSNASSIRSPSGSKEESRESTVAPSHAPLSLEIGICIPLYLVGNKCRDPTLRRRAVTILDAAHCKEGIWESRGAARVVERMMHIEEQAAREWRAAACSPDTDAGDIQVHCAADIPEAARVKVNWTEVDMPARAVKLKCQLRSGSWDAPIWKLIDETIHF